MQTLALSFINLNLDRFEEGVVDLHQFHRAALAIKGANPQYELARADWAARAVPGRSTSSTSEKESWPLEAIRMDLTSAEPFLFC